MSYLDLLSHASQVDYSAWADTDVLASAVDLEARRRGKSKGGGGGLIFGLICLLVIVAIVVAVVVMMRKKNSGGALAVVPGCLPVAAVVGIVAWTRSDYFADVWLTDTTEQLIVSAHPDFVTVVDQRRTGTH